MSALYHTEETPQLICWDRNYYTNFEDQLNALKQTRTIYVGNLSFFTREEQLLETFSVVGPVKRVIMGLNSVSKTPCGFCFIEYYNQEHYKAALKYISGTVCDDRIIRCDADGGFKPGRQFGRGKSGGQVRDERRNNIDMSRSMGLVVPSVLGKSKHRDRDEDGSSAVLLPAGVDGREMDQLTRLQSGLSVPR